MNGNENRGGSPAAQSGGESAAEDGFDGFTGFSPRNPVKTVIVGSTGRMGAMLLGSKRSLAAEYSFIAAVPIMVAATGYDMLKSWHLFSAADIPFFAVGMIGSFISALIAVKAFVRLVGHMTLVPFAVYRLLLAPFIWYFMVH